MAGDIDGGILKKHLPFEMQVLGHDNLLHKVELNTFAAKLHGLYAEEIKIWGEANKLWTRGDDLFETSELPDGLNLPNAYALREKLYEFLSELNRTRFVKLIKSKTQDTRDHIESLAKELDIDVEDDNPNRIGEIVHLNWPSNKQIG